VPRRPTRQAGLGGTTVGRACPTGGTRATGAVDRTLALGEALLASGETSVRLNLAEVAAEAGRPTVAAEQLAAIAEDTPRANVLNARIAYDLGDPEAAITMAEKALLAARTAGQWPVACAALQVLGRVARLTDLAQARAAFAEAAELALAHNLPVERISALHELGTVDLLVDGDVDLLLRARCLAVEAGLLALTATLDVQIAAGCLHRDPDEALYYARRCARMAQGLQMERLRATALFFSAAGHAHRRDVEAREQAVGEALAAAPDDLDVNAGIWGAVRAHVALLADDLSALATCLDTAMDYLRASASTTPASTRGLWALVRTVQDPDGQAARDEARPSTVNWENRALLGYAEAVAAGRRGDLPAAERAFAEADIAMAKLPWWQHRIRLLIAPDATAAGWGDPVSWANVALGVFTARGDEELAARCRSVYTQAGVPVRRKSRVSTPVPPRLAAHGVTGREMDVLALAGDGLTDAQIATRLFLSPRTVETHILHLRVKTGTANRGALIRLLRARADRRPQECAS
jgi:DNA-binding CsgD family transcriptional regulator